MLVFIKVTFVKGCFIMRVLHISTSDNGGAGRCCIRIHKALLECGIDSKVVVKDRFWDNPQVYSYGAINERINRIPSKVFRICGLKITDRNKILAMSMKYNAYYTLPVSSVDLTKNEWYDWADIIHLHFVSDYLDYPSFFNKTKKKIVWTLHDESLFYGVAHWQKDVLIDNKIEDWYRCLKEKIIKNVDDLNIIFLSKMIYDKYKDKPIIRGRNMTIINNPVDGTIFKPYNKFEMRQKYGLEQHKIYLLFISTDVTNPIKGLELLSRALTELNLKNVEILAIGDNPRQKSFPFTKIYGLVNDEKELSELISTADYFVMPSFQEGFAQSPMEAMACGLPVLAFPVSGTDELINQRNGIVCKEFNIEALKKGICQIMSCQYNGDEIRRDLLNRFSSMVIAQKYIDFYHSLL